MTKTTENTAHENTVLRPSFNDEGIKLFFRDFISRVEERGEPSDRHNARTSAAVVEFEKKHGNTIDDAMGLAVEFEENGFINGFKMALSIFMSSNKPDIFG